MADLDAEFALFQQELADVETEVAQVEVEAGLEQPSPLTTKLRPPLSSPPARPIAGQIAAPAAIHVAAAPQPYKCPVEPVDNVSRAASAASGVPRLRPQQYLPGGAPMFVGNAPPIAQENKRVGLVREAAGERWVDTSLIEWPQNDFRLFVGNIGPEVSDQMLTNAFAHYPSFNMAKVVREKYKNKPKGYGFVSLQDPIEGTKALREMDGKYIGNRPVQLKKSNWDDRNLVDPKSGKVKMKSVTQKNRRLKPY